MLCGRSGHDPYIFKKCVRQFSLQRQGNGERSPARPLFSFALSGTRATGSPSTGCCGGRAEPAFTGLCSAQNQGLPSPRLPCSAVRAQVGGQAAGSSSPRLEGVSVPHQPFSSPAWPRTMTRGFGFLNVDRVGTVSARNGRRSDLCLTQRVLGCVGEASPDPGRGVPPVGAVRLLVRGQGQSRRAARPLETTRCRALLAVAPQIGRASCRERV